RRALHIEGTLPSSFDGGVLVQLEPPATMAVGEVPWGLAPHLAGVVRLHEDGTTAGAEADKIAASADGRTIVVVSRDTHRHPWARAVVERLSTNHPQV